MAIENAGAVPMDCDELMEGRNATEIVVETNSLDMPCGDAEEPIPSEYVYSIGACWC